MYRLFFKRLIDFLTAALGLIILSPLFVLIVIILFFNNKGNPFFFQVRPGKNGRNFKIVKFKTMNDKKDFKGNLLPDVERMTLFGNVIRKSSLDEIPQFINILMGDMSLIGPRPLLVEYMSLYNLEQQKRHSVRPGITGWAQVNGRNAISWKRKFELDVYYVQNYSFPLDLKILYMTFLKVIKKEGINASSNTTMEAFNGRN